MTVMAPSNAEELKQMLYLAAGHDGPCAIRYPKGPANERIPDTPVEYGKGEVVLEGEDVAVIALGSRVKVCIEAAEQLSGEGIHPTVINARFAKPIDTSLLLETAKTHSTIVTVEEGVVSGGFGERAAEIMNEHSYKGTIVNMGIPDRFISHGKAESLLAHCRLSAQDVAEKVREHYHKSAE